jgi:K+-transporting ATPase ATPase C chain
MWQQILPALRMGVFLTVVLGIVYPLAMTGISQVFFPYKANGSLIISGGRVIGSELIGQNFTRPEYFHPRPSSAGANGYDATASGGYNQGPTNRKLIERVAAAVERFRRENPDYRGPIPADLVTGSASGLDPHLSPDSARAQAGRVARARGVPVQHIDELIARYTQDRTLGLLGEPRVNVLRLNLALDRELPKR